MVKNHIKFLKETAWRLEKWVVIHNHSRQTQEIPHMVSLASLNFQNVDDSLFKITNVAQIKFSNITLIEKFSSSKKVERQMFQSNP